jgi:arylsulfatase A-like enzyme
MAGPQIPTGRLSRTVARSIDVLPTLADYAGLPRRNDVDGRSLRAAADGQELPDAPSYAESLYPETEFGWSPLYAWPTARFKFIKAPRSELYDLENDASETSSRLNEDQTRANDLGRKLEEVLRVTPPPVAARAVDPDTAERLRALGYASGGGAARVPGPRFAIPKTASAFSLVSTAPCLRRVWSPRLPFES